MKMEECKVKRAYEEAKKRGEKFPAIAIKCDCSKCNPSYE